MRAIEETVGFALARAGMLHRARALGYLSEIGLHPGQEVLLFLLWERDGQSPGDLAARMQVEPATVTKMLRRLVRVGLVRREQDPDDGRRVRVRLTGAGRDLEQSARAAWRRLEADTVACLDEDERRTLRSLLLRVRDGLADRSPS